jgi:hypothetical protein
MLQQHERAWWWKIAMHLDEAQRSMTNVLVHNVDDPTPVHLLQAKFREAQAFLLEIFRWKGLLPGTVFSGPVASTAVAADVTGAAFTASVDDGQSTAVTSVDEIPHADGVVPASQADEIVLTSQIIGEDPAQEILSKSASNIDALLHREGLAR